MMTRDQNGFSLIELLLVIVMIGVLAGTAIAQYSSYRSRSVDSKVVSVVRHVATGQEAYYSGHFTYTPDANALTGVAIDGVTIAIAAGNSGDLATSFRVEGSHPAAGRSYVWVSDPEPGMPHLLEN